MIEDLISLVIERAPPIAGDNLLGFRMDLDVLLVREPLFATSSIAVTENPRTRLKVTLGLGPAATSLQDVSFALERIWSMTGYRFFKASSVVMTRSEVSLRFATMIDESTYSVTGVFTVSGGGFSKLVDKYEAGWGKLPDSR